MFIRHPVDRPITPWRREGIENGDSSGTVSDTKERMHGALMPSSGGPSLRWEHKVELWKHPKARHILYSASVLPLHPASSFRHAASDCSAGLL